ncbi:transporter substrate-binding domain-containing protein [Rhizobium metallidurans]|uniref:Polar amino acid transport system substrate-binding protein n=1 Tax=Rhizobium metallidurans TaxID=1265931 RepID=A0A7W6GCH8_9HYPH|nr:transporter substrate-binding domain-containing protein [Rhizobium metallidurans]MBB3966085.1 polar amino acid transport system substrate-binding protein [Rhizobium metallidurans]
MINLKSVAVALGLALISSIASAQSMDCGNDTLCKIKASGVLKIGTKDDYRPWAYRAPDGGFKGMEVDFGRKIADILGVKAEFVKVTTANRFEFLLQGQVDLLLASASETLERRKLVTFVHPNYYSSGYSVLTPKAVNATDWSQIKGQTVCAIQGAFYNKPAQENNGVTILAFSGTSEIEAALAQGRCIGLLEDDNRINVRLADSKWSEGFHMTLPVQDDTPWGMVIRPADDNTAYSYFLSGVVSQMHRDGTLLELEKANGIQNSAFLIKMNNALKDTLK